MLCLHFTSLLEHHLQHFNVNIWFGFTAHKQTNRKKWQKQNDVRHLDTLVLTILHHIIHSPGSPPFISRPRLSDSWERMANLVQSITCFDTTICLRSHINCFGSLCSIMLPHIVLLCHTRFQVGTRMMKPGRNAGQNLTMCSSGTVCVCSGAGVHLSEVPEMLTAIERSGPTVAHLKHFLDLTTVRREGFGSYLEKCWNSVSKVAFCCLYMMWFQLTQDVVEPN